MWYVTKHSDEWKGISQEIGHKHYRNCKDYGYKR
jgi:hypothetical protein